MTDAGRRHLTVLQSVQLGRPRPSYPDHLVDALPVDQVGALSFSYRDALLGEWDVLHVHWPESLLRHGRRSRRAVRALCLLLLLLRVQVTRRAVVRTLHNVRPHESGSRSERALLAALDRRVTCSVRLTEATPAPRHGRVVTIPHGHYQAQLGTPEREPASPRALLFFGYIREYKRVDALLDAFADLDDPDASLAVVGAPGTPALADLVRSAAARDARVHAVLDFVPDKALAQHVLDAALIVLPYEEIHNSGVIFAALSLDRPVMVPENAVTRALREEVGADFVLTYRAPLTAEHLRDALERVAARPPSSRPDLGGRSWEDVAEAHVEVYRAAVAEVRR